jgi:metallo-beta-lactamase family protein
MNATLGFHGAAGTVTGSKYLLEVAGRRILIDCGMFQGLKELRQLNCSAPPFDPRTVDHVLLTHVHIDHLGYLPRLVRQGYAGPVHCTPPSVELAALMLLDAAKLQMEDAAYANKRGFSKHEPALPLFDEADARRTLTLLRAAGYGDRLDLGGGVRARFVNAGHILGSASIELRFPHAGREASLVFSGDLGRYDAPLHLDPDDRPPSDLLVIESTYGDREHDATPVADQIRQAFGETFARRGIVLIPAFAVGRTQQVALILRDLMRTGDLQDVPIHVDSPMAAEATRIYARHLHDHNLDEGISEDGTHLFPKQVKFHRTTDESKHLNDLPGPRVIISASGMLTGGRVLHHLERKAPDPKNLICLMGFQAAGTRGRALLDGATSVRLHGTEVPVLANVMAVHGLSGHAGRSELLRWARSAPAPRGVFVTHGEPQASLAFAGDLHAAWGLEPIVPARGETRDLTPLLAG